MMKEMEELLKKAKPLSTEAKEARKKSVEDLKAMLKDGIAGDIKKVTVASNSKEGVQEGLDKAKEMLEQTKEAPEKEENEECEMEEESSESTEELSEEQKIAKLEKELEELKAKKKGNDLNAAKNSIKSIF